MATASYVEPIVSQPVMSAPATSSCSSCSGCSTCSTGARATQTRAVATKGTTQQKIVAKPRSTTTKAAKAVVR
jgi:hypothetical protein